MGVLIAQAAKLRGAEVDLVHGPISVQKELLEGLNTFPVRSANEMGEKIDHLQPTAQVIVMAAAVSDFKKNNYKHQRKATRTYEHQQKSKNDKENIRQSIKKQRKSTRSY